MTERQLFRAIGSVDAELVEAAGAFVAKSPRLRLVPVRWAAVAACLALLIGLGVWRYPPPAPQLLPQPTVSRMDGVATFHSPMGMRKFFHFNGYRYAFSGDGAPSDFSAVQLAGSLGVLEYDVMDSADGQDRATTFALGGTLYEISGYDPAFRIGVAWEGEYYLAELVGRADNLPLEPAYYLEVAELEDRAVQVHVRSHMGGEALYTTGKKREVKNMARLLSGANMVELSNQDYEALARAQAEGRSWQLEFSLKDGTSITMYLAPEQGLVSMGDSTYGLPFEFLTLYANIFEGLEQGPLPYH